MKRFNLIVLFALLLLFAVSPVMAQDASAIPAPDTSEDTVIFGLIAIIAVLVVVFGGALGYAIAKAADSIPPSLRPIIEEAIRTGYARALVEARGVVSTTPSTLDDDLLDFIDQRIRQAIAESLPNTDVSVDGTTLTDDVYNS